MGICFSSKDIREQKKFLIDRGIAKHIANGVDQWDDEQLARLNRIMLGDVCKEIVF
jgi:hypothetical protein